MLTQADLNFGLSFQIFLPHDKTKITFIGLCHFGNWRFYLLQTSKLLLTRVMTMVMVDHVRGIQEHAQRQDARVLPSGRRDRRRADRD